MKNSERVGMLLDYILELIQRSDSFVQSQAPVVVQELLTYLTISTIVNLVLAVVSIPVSVYLIRFLYLQSAKFGNRVDNANDSHEEFVFIVGFVGCIVLAILLALSTLFVCVRIPEQVDKLIKLKTAPSVVLIEWVKEQM